MPQQRSQIFILVINNSECEGIANVITSISLNGTGKKPTDLQQQHKHEHTPISFHAVALNMHFNFEKSEQFIEKISKKILPQKYQSKVQKILISL